MLSCWPHHCDPSQDTLGLIDSLGTLLAHVQLVLASTPGSFSTKHLSLKSVVLQGVVTQGQDQ